MQLFLHELEEERGGRREEGWRVEGMREERGKRRGDRGGVGRRGGKGIGEEMCDKRRLRRRWKKGVGEKRRGEMTGRSE